MSMNRVQAEKYRDTLLNHKYNLIHMLPSTEIPELSGFYLKNFYNGTKRYRLKLPETITESEGKFCGNCGAVRIPLFNTRMSVLESGNEREDSNEIIRTIQCTCLHCDNHAELAPIRILKNEVGSGQPIGSKEEKVKQGKLNKTSSARGRVKKKKNTLSNMLSQKNEEKRSKSFSLSLEHMMRNE